MYVWQGFTLPKTRVVTHPGASSTGPCVHSSLYHTVSAVERATAPHTNLYKIIIVIIPKYIKFMSVPIKYEITKQSNVL